MRDGREQRVDSAGGLEGGDGVGESGAGLGGVDAFEHGGQQVFGAVDVVVGDRSVEAREFGRDELGSRRAAEVARGEVAQVVEELEQPAV